MTLSARIHTPDGVIGVADNAAGDQVITALQDRYKEQDIPAYIYDRNDIWGKQDISKVTPLMVTTLAKFEW